MLFYIQAKNNLILLADTLKQSEESYKKLAEKETLKVTQKLEAESREKQRVIGVDDSETPANNIYFFFYLF